MCNPSPNWGYRDQNSGYVRCNRQADPRMLDAHQAVPTCALRPAENGALQNSNGKDQGNRGPLAPAGVTQEEGVLGEQTVKPPQL